MHLDLKTSLMLRLVVGALACFFIAAGLALFGTYRDVRQVNARVAEVLGLVSRVTPVHTAQRNCTRDGGWPFGFGNQVSISSRRKLLSSKATVVNVAETSGHDPGRHGRERRAQANRCGSVEMRLGDVKTGG